MQSTRIANNENINTSTSRFIQYLGWIVAFSTIFLDNFLDPNSTFSGKHNFRNFNKLFFHTKSKDHTNFTYTIDNIEVTDMNWRNVFDKLIDDVSTLRKEKYEIRRQFGELSCACKAIGPTGGYCLDIHTSKIGDNNILPVEMATRIYKLLKGKHIIDLGAGIGHYEEHFNNLNTANPGSGPASWIAYDGAENIELVTDGKVRWADLTEKQNLGIYDWVISLEVAEHIPAEKESIFLDNLDRHNTEGMIISWAVIGQDGYFHVNTQDSAYVISTITDLGYTYNEPLSLELRKLGEASMAKWFANNVYVFQKKKSKL